MVAFERTYRNPFTQMKALCWRTTEDSAGPQAAQRLRALRQSAEQIAGAPVCWQHPNPPAPPVTWGSCIAGWVGVLLVITFIALVLLGMGRLVVTGAELVRE